MKKSKDEYRFWSINISNFKAYIDSSINYEVRDKRHYRDDAKVYKFMSHVEISGICTWPEEIEGCECHMIIYGDESRQNVFKQTLSDCHVRDVHGVYKYKKLRGKETPIYDVPKGLGLIEKQRGQSSWNGCIWVSPETISNMLMLLPTVKPLYIFMHERKVERNRWIVGFTLQTSDPAEE